MSLYWSVSDLVCKETQIIVLSSSRVPGEAEFLSTNTMIYLHSLFNKQYNFEPELRSLEDLRNIVKINKCGHRLKTTDMMIKHLKENQISVKYGKNIHSKNMIPHQESISESVFNNKIFERNRMDREKLQKITSLYQRQADKIYEDIQNKSISSCL